MDPQFDRRRPAATEETIQPDGVIANLAELPDLLALRALGGAWRPEPFGDVCSPQGAGGVSVRSKGVGHEGFIVVCSSPSRRGDRAGRVGIGALPLHGGERRRRASGTDHEQDSHRELVAQRAHGRCVSLQVTQVTTPTVSSLFFFVSEQFCDVAKNEEVFRSFGAEMPASGDVLVIPNNLASAVLVRPQPRSER